MATLDQQTPVSDVPWPKRTNKACCNCRRDKIKCDGERPCAACLRRGLTDEKCIDGCPPCRRSRARCDGGDPCSRCLELGIDCANEPTSPDLSIDESMQRQQTTTTRSAPSGRAKLACQACRRDNKKCDDSRPCSRCVSRMEECVHVERIPKAVKHRCISCRKDNKKCEDSRPCRHCAEMNLECIDAPRKGSGGSRVKMACANCRKNKVQCDPERPCRVCVRRGLGCTAPSCTCAETGNEPGTCTFCRSQRSKRSSQTRSDAGSFDAIEEKQNVNAETSRSGPSNLHLYGELAHLQTPLSTPSQSHAYGHYIPSQGRTLSMNIPPAADTFARHPYESVYSAHQDTSFQSETGQQALSEIPHPGNSFEYHTRSNNQEQHQGLPISLSHSTQHDFLSSENAFTNFGGLTNPNTGSANTLDKYLARGAMEPSGESSFTPTGSTAQGSFTDSTGVGIGTYKSDGLTDFGSLSPQAYGPVPMAMPVSVTIPVPVPHSIHPHKDAQSVGQIDMHPQLRRSAYYLTSDSRTAQRGEGA